MPLTPPATSHHQEPTMTPEQRRQGLAFNAVSRTLSAHDEFVRLSVRQAVARAVLAAIDAEARQSSAEPSHVVLRIDGVAAGQLFSENLRRLVRTENRPEAGFIRQRTEPTQDSTGWTWTCHLCPHGQDGYWTRWGALRGQNRHYATHTTGADHA